MTMSMFLRESNGFEQTLPIECHCTNIVCDKCIQYALSNITKLYPPNGRQKEERKITTKIILVARNKEFLSFIILCCFQSENILFVLVISHIK